MISHVYLLSNATTQATALLSLASTLKEIRPSEVLLNFADRINKLRKASFTLPR
jgi:hypothetical protein